ncbi:MAG: type II toxin-antitoxin system RelE/ParE family toxin [Pyrinomonadaceae bacterium]|nr:type II toxin-antitoxin system RelE/ParE family toxin [Sphingobacteriaceae bacterium]
MSYKIYTITYFDKQLKRLVKKYPSLKHELAELIETLKSSPETGTALGNECYKIRIAIASKGKSGGARVITYFVISNASVYLLSIYDKSEQSDISNKDLLKLLEYTK